MFPPNNIPNNTSSNNSSITLQPANNQCLQSNAAAQVLFERSLNELSKIEKPLIVVSTPTENKPIFARDTEEGNPTALTPNDIQSKNLPSYQKIITELLEISSKMCSSLSVDYYSLIQNVINELVQIINKSDPEIEASSPLQNSTIIKNILEIIGAIGSGLSKENVISLFTTLLKDVPLSADIYLDALISYPSSYKYCFNLFANKYTLSQPQISTLLDFLESSAKHIDSLDKLLTQLSGQIEEDSLKIEFLEYLQKTQLNSPQILHVLYLFNNKDSSNQTLLLFLIIAKLQLGKKLQAPLFSSEEQNRQKFISERLVPTMQLLVDNVTQITDPHQKFSTFFHLLRNVEFLPTLCRIQLLNSAYEYLQQLESPFDFIKILTSIAHSINFFSKEKHHSLLEQLFVNIEGMLTRILFSKLKLESIKEIIPFCLSCLHECWPSNNPELVPQALNALKAVNFLISYLYFSDAKDFINLSLKIIQTKALSSGNSIEIEETIQTLCPHNKATSGYFMEFFDFLEKLSLDSKELDPFIYTCLLVGWSNSANAINSSDNTKHVHFEEGTYTPMELDEENDVGTESSDVNMMEDVNLDDEANPNLSRQTLISYLKIIEKPSLEQFRHELLLAIAPYLKHHVTLHAQYIELAQNPSSLKNTLHGLSAIIEFLDMEKVISIHSYIKHRLKNESLEPENYKYLVPCLAALKKKFEHCISIDPNLGQNTKIIAIINGLQREMVIYIEKKTDCIA